MANLIEKTSLRWRIFATTILLLICISTLTWGSITIEKALILNLVAGLLVLATAGIWVSYFAEREAHRTALETAEEIRQATRVSRACAEIGIRDLFSSSDSEEYNRFITEVLLHANSQSNVRVLGIACRGFYHADGGPNNPHISNIARRSVPMRVVAQHPLFEPAISRGLREDINRNLFSEHSTSILVTDVIRSCEGLLGLNSNAIEARLCPVAVHCRATFIDDLLIYEPHHFGQANKRASLNTPVLVFNQATPFAVQVAAHFEFLWEVSAPHPVSTKLVSEIRRRKALLEDESALRAYMIACRPDLFGPKTSASDNDEGSDGAEQTSEADA